MDVECSKAYSFPFIKQSVKYDVLRPQRLKIYAYLAALIIMTRSLRKVYD